MQVALRSTGTRQTSHKPCCNQCHAAFLFSRVNIDNGSKIVILVICKGKVQALPHGVRWLPLNDYRLQSSAHASHKMNEPQPCELIESARNFLSPIAIRHHDHDELLHRSKTNRPEILFLPMYAIDRSSLLYFFQCTWRRSNKIANWRAALTTRRRRSTVANDLDSSKGCNSRSHEPAVPQSKYGQAW